MDENQHNQTSWTAGAWRAFTCKPTEEEIERAKREIAMELVDAIMASEYIVQPHGDTGCWTVGIKVILSGKEPSRPPNTQETGSMKACRDLRAHMDCSCHE